MVEGLKEIISKELIFLDENFKNQDEVIEFVALNAEKLGYIKNRTVLYDAVKKREQEVSTAIGYSIAIPHGKTDTVEHPFIAFTRTSDELKWTDEGEELVQLIFLIGVPKSSEGKLHLKFISQLSKKLLDDKFRFELLNKKNKEEIFEQLSSIEI